MLPQNDSLNDGHDSSLTPRRLQFTYYFFRRPDKIRGESSAVRECVCERGGRANEIPRIVECVGKVFRSIGWFADASLNYEYAKSSDLRTSEQMMEAIERRTDKRAERKQVIEVCNNKCSTCPTSVCEHRKYNGNDEKRNFLRRLKRRQTKMVRDEVKKNGKTYTEIFDE